MASTQPQTVYISFSAEINATTSEGLLRVCCELASKGTKTVYIMLSTPGGDVAHGISIYNVLRSLPCEVITHNVSSVNSIGIVVFLAGAKRYANPGTTFMFHGVGFNASNVRFEERNLVERLNGIRAEQKKIATIIETRATFPNEREIKSLFLKAATKETQFAKDRGIIHDVREAKVPVGVPVLQLVFKR